jgi:hypothetical protein
MAKSGLSDRIRLLVSERYVQPAMKLGSERLSIRVKDILNDVAHDPDARGRTPAICEVLQGNKLLRENDLEIEGVDGPPSKQSTTVVVHYRILHPGQWAGASQAARKTQTTALPVETPKERARRLTNRMAGLLKDEIAAYGGGDAFMKWVRSDDDEAA